MNATASSIRGIAGPRFGSVTQSKPVRQERRNWVQWFIIFQIVCQLLLLTSIAAGPTRAVIRIATFGISLLALAFVPGRGKLHPAAKPVAAVMGLMAISFFHPTTNNFLSGAAQILLYLAILAPLYWVPRFNLDMRAVRTVLLTLWAFHALSSLFGVLQVYYPGRFQPNVSVLVASQGSTYLRNVSIVVANGERVMRPMGLTDVPGGAGMGGFYTVLFGMGFLLTERGMARRAIFVGSMLLGMMALYLSQVRALLVMLACCMVVFLILLALRGFKMKLAILSSVLAGIVVVSFLWAASVGGASVTRRLALLVASSPTNTYYQGRGKFLEYTIKELLPRYPLGAGLGRWGMTNTYFGDKSKLSIWAEIMWTGWLLDGGVPLILAYVAMLWFAFVTALKLSLRRSQGDLWLWGTVLLSYNCGAIALTFSYPFFISQGGMEFWMLNALLFTAAQSSANSGWFVRRLRTDTKIASYSTSNFR